MFNQQDSGVVMVTQFGISSSSSFVSFGLRPAAGSSTLKSPAASPYSGQSPDGAGHIGQVTRLTVGMFQQTNALKPVAARSSASLWARRKEGVFNSRRTAQFSVADAVPPAGFQSRHFTEQTYMLEGAHHAHAGNCCPGKPSRC